MSSGAQTDLAKRPRLNQELLYVLARRIRLAGALLRWHLQAFSGLVAPSGFSGARRLLMIYDFSSHPFSIGDILVIQEASLVLRKVRGLDRVDLAFVYDPAAPVVPDPAFSQIGPDNFLWHLSTVLQAAQVNPYLGSVFLFDSHRRLEEFASGNLDTYEVWPTLRQYASREYLYYHVFNELLFEYFQREKTLPSLESRAPARAWARAFVERHVGADVPVTVQLRRNSANPERDTDNDSWIRFFESCRARYPAKFLIICAQHEVDPRLRQLSNVVVAKDHCTNVEQDLSLIEVAAIHMGASSGPGAVAIFSRKPYCLFNTDLQLDLYRGSTHEGHRAALFFGNSSQSFLFGRENPELIATEFERMWKALRGSSSGNPQESATL